MASRIRTIKPEFPQSESMGNVTRDARLCFILLWTVSDDEGRLRGNSRMLASLLFPYDIDAPSLIDGWLKELESQNCILRYEAAGHNYIEITNWKTEQKIDRPSPSRLPPSSRTIANNHEQSRTLDREGNGREGKGIRKVAKATSLLGRVPPEMLAGTLPLIDGTDYEITKLQMHEWTEAFPAVDIKQQMLEFKEWLKANPERRKTRKGILRAVFHWLSREQDKGGVYQGGGRTNGTSPAQSRQATTINSVNEVVARLRTVDRNGAGPGSPAGGSGDQSGTPVADRRGVT